MTEHKIEEYTTQVVVITTIMGRQPRFAPAGFSFDKTACHVWSRMLYYASELDKMDRNLKRHRKMDRHLAEAKLQVLGDVISNSLGMVSFYWVQAAKVFHNQQPHDRER